MGKYFALRIEMGKLDYHGVIEKYPQYKDEIDSILAADGYEPISIEEGTTGI